MQYIDPQGGYYILLCRYSYGIILVFITEYDYYHFGYRSIVPTGSRYTAEEWDTLTMFWSEWSMAMGKEESEGESGLELDLAYWKGATR